MSDSLVGPLILAFSKESPVQRLASCAISPKTNDKLIVKIIAMGGKLLSPVIWRRWQQCRPAMKR